MKIASLTGKAQREPVAIKGLPANVRKAIRNARMDASHDHLNALLDEK